MLEIAVLGIFSVMLITSVALGVPLIQTLSVGLVLFAGYVFYSKYTVRQFIGMCLKGLQSTRGVLMLLFIVGLITASWRASGTIATIVTYASYLVVPEFFVLIAFCLCAGMGMLLGSAMGTAATMGVICMTIANSLQINPLLAGGAILAGALCGDRSSPVSSSANLIATLTHTDVFENMRRTLKTGFVPFLASCAFYLVCGLQIGFAAETPDIQALFSQQFILSWITLAPAVVMLILSVLRIDVRLTMLASLVVAVGICLGVQGVALESLPQILVFGFHSEFEELAPMINGGGLLSMLNILGVISLASCYAGIFKETGMLEKLQHYITALAQHTTPYVSVLLTSMFTSIIACNQTFAIMLTTELCQGPENSGRALALELQNSVLVMAPLVPWSISSIAVLSFIGAPTQSLFFAIFLYLIPLWTLALSIHGGIHPAFFASHFAHSLGLDESDFSGRQIHLPERVIRYEWSAEHTGSAFAL